MIYNPTTDSSEPKIDYSVDYQSDFEAASSTLTIPSLTTLAKINPIGNVTLNFRLRLTVHTLDYNGMGIETTSSFLVIWLKQQ